MLPHIFGMNLVSVLVGIPILAVALADAKMSNFIEELKGKKIFGKEGKNLNLTWKYEIKSLPPHGTKILEFLFGEWKYPGYVSRKCLKVDENGNVEKAKNCEEKYGYEGNGGNNGVYQSKVMLYNLTKSDMEKTYGIDIEMGIYRSPLEDWFELRTFEKANITHFSISSNATVKEGHPASSVGDAVNITCQATGGPEPNVSLSKQDQVIKEGKGEVMHIIDKVAMKDAGEYVCVASNDREETVERRITLSVEGSAAQQTLLSGTTVQPTTSGSKKCISEPWMLGFLLLSRWI
ncbi:neuronal growth regulator 1-like [Actinia tenebrosa]|uniref:Neuronal growth regulator 1-like n=1 Tax=Actinia tenebrosa TaxID=6105 RepID=A0A6P8I9A2_ACTTE|nr:neuronal growth regulator 1-like [Actinia tenebrosa]